MAGAQRGVSLVEMIVFILIVGVSLAGIMVAVRPGLERSGDPHIRYRINELAQLYLDEAISRRYDQATPVGGVPSCVSSANCTAAAAFGPDAGEDRATWNDSDDYHGLREGNAAACSVAGPMDSVTLLDSRGQTRQGYAGFCVEMNVAYDGDFDGVVNEAGATELQAKRIRVTVSASDGASVGYSAYRGGF